MALEKLAIAKEKNSSAATKRPSYSSYCSAMFNPEKLVINRVVKWNPQNPKGRDVPQMQYDTGQPRTLSVDLFFDTYDSPKANKESVRKKYTDKIAALTTVEEHPDMHRPPVCQLSWGAFGVIFEGVLEKLEQRFTMFMEDGTPVRATLGCSFQEYRTNEYDAEHQATRSTDVAKSRVVKQGDSLSSIASEEYSDPKLWRSIADENRIDNPFDLIPGTRLLIPTRPRGVVK